MNNMIVKLGVRLFLFCLIAAIALAITNEVTKGPIAEQALKSKMAALNTVMPGCTYEEADIGELEEGSELDELFIAKDKDGNIVGYAITASPNGYGGEIPITFGISAEGHITQVYVGSLQETAGSCARPRMRSPIQRMFWALRLPWAIRMPSLLLTTRQTAARAKRKKFL